MSKEETLEEAMQRLEEEAIRRHSLEVCKAAMRIAKRTREESAEKRRENNERIHGQSRGPLA